MIRVVPERGDGLALAARVDARDIAVLSGPGQVARLGDRRVELAHRPHAHRIDAVQALAA